MYKNVNKNEITKGFWPQLALDFIFRSYTMALTYLWVLEKVTANRTKFVYDFLRGYADFFN